MAIATSVLSNRYMRSNRLTEAIDAFFSKDRSQTKNVSKRLEEDLLELSPYNQIRQKIAEFKQETNVASRLNLKLTVSSETFEESEELDPKIDRDLDLMLRMVSKDEKEYKSLRARFEKLLGLARHNFSDNAGEVVPDEGGNTGQIAANSAGHSAYEFAMKFSKQTVESERIGISLEELGIKKADPLVLDLAGDGINLTKAGQGAIFDITADGKLDSTAWVQGDDALLAYDRNGNSKIDDGSELFGDQNGAENGFIELSKHDQNKDNRIDRLDPIFKALKLYQDINGNGKIDEGELFSLEDKGIKALNLNFVHTNREINGNSLLLSGNFEREDGSEGLLADVLLGYRTI